MLNHNLVYAASVRHYTITIPKESTNPEVDITILGPKQCYLLRELSINSNDTAAQINNYTEDHNVTSGIGGGMESLINTNKLGMPAVFLITVYLSQDKLGHTHLLNLVYIIIFVLYILG